MMNSRSTNVYNFRRSLFHGDKGEPGYEEKYHPGKQMDWIGGDYPVRLPYPGAVTKRLYNASLVSHPPETNDRFGNQWLEPHVSDWVKEVAGGTGYLEDDNPESRLDEITRPLVFMSDEPTGWIESIVNRQTGAYNQPTLDDVREYGRLNIIDADVESSIYRVGDYSYTQELENLQGDRIKFYETDLYDEGDVYTGEGSFIEMPVGPEPNDYITKEIVDVSYSLTGDELVDYIRAVDPNLYERLKKRESR
jgi:hypothetical protein